MKLNIFITKVILICLIPAFAVARPSGDIVISQQHYQVPILLQKKDNPVLRIHLHNGSAGDLQLTEMMFNVAGTTDCKDIKQFNLYYTGADSGMRNLGSVEKIQLVGSVTKVGEKLSVTGSQSLSPGDHYFWLSVELNKGVPLTHVVAVNATNAMMNGKSTKIEGVAKFQQRIGIALRQHNQDSVHTYRIPGLSTAKDGSLLAIYDVRRESARDLQGNIDIGVSRSTDGGNTWLPMQIAIDMGKWGGLPEKFNGVSDANVLVDKNTGAIFIAGLWMHGVLSEEGIWVEWLTDTSTNWNHQWRNKGSQPGFDEKHSAQFMIVKSVDNGKTWSKPVNITQQCKQEAWWLWAPAPGAGITLHDGTLVFPTQGRDKSGKAFSNITYSKDGGVTWHTSNRASKESTTENMAVELSDGTVMLNMRCNKNQKDTGDTNGRVIAITRNLGEDWTEHPTSRGALHEPVCMASILRHKYVVKGQKKSILLFANPDSKTLRHHMTIKVSYDDGATWQTNKKILLDEWKSRGYSCMTSIDAETIGIVYESSQCDLVFQQVKIKELLP
ncbi:sialidase [Niastella koreensis]|uniref:exo-alpha-sialidase n=2 Tax=Niastella koreensis TaxID=354356 RepID=G8T9E3_NIAKG|nr:sialidase family protein [Niastella koreensis]AEV99133.1 glycosyl hydrolase BNR repeat-containing protein [Niastella koreensis GR20-10]OQP44040.1 sialidase [Niastella koreensis]